MKNVGEELAKARKRKGLSQEKLALELPVSRESLAKYEIGSRKIPDDIRDDIAIAVDDVEYYFVTWNAAAGEVAIPYLDGDYIDKHPSSMMILTKKETSEALENLESFCWYKPNHCINDLEKKQLKQAMFEILDAATSLVNLVGILCRDYEYSMKSIFKEWRLSLKIRKLKK